MTPPASIAVLAAFCLAAVLAGGAHAQGGVGYIPPAAVCDSSPQGVRISSFQVSTGFGSFGSMVGGTVTLVNGGLLPVRVGSVQVQLDNDAVVAPLFLAASCPQSHIPSSPIPYQLGSMTCTFSAPLPTGGPAASPSAWTRARATLTLAKGGVCPSVSARIHHSGSQPVPVYNPAQTVPVVDPAVPVVGSEQQDQVPTVLGRRLRASAPAPSPAPASCPLTIVTRVEAAASGAHQISGRVVLNNLGREWANMGHVTITLENNVPVAPLVVLASCPRYVATKGDTVCTFSFKLPASGPTASAAAWPTVTAVATLLDAATLSNTAPCRAAHAKVQAQPLVMG